MNSLIEIGRRLAFVLLTMSVVAVESGRRTSESSASSVAMLVRLGDRLMQETRETVAHDFGEAENAYREALELSPSHADALVGMAWVKNSEHDFAAGKKWANRALEINPSNLHAYALLADGAMELGQYDEAFIYVQKALDIRSDLSTLSRAGHLLWLTGDSDKAKEMMLLAIRSGGPFYENIAWCRSELGLMHFHEGDIEAAKEQAAIAFKLAPENPRVLNLLGRIYAVEGGVSEAIGYYQKAFSISAMHESLAALVDLYTRSGDEHLARVHTRKVMSLHKEHHHGEGEGHDHGQGNAELALFMADHGIRPGAAVHEAEHAYDSFPNVRSADALAWCYFKNGQLEDALRMSKMAISWETPYAEFHYHHGMILQAIGKESESRTAFEKASKMNPRFRSKWAKAE